VTGAGRVRCRHWPPAIPPPDRDDQRRCDPLRPSSPSQRDPVLRRGHAGPTNATTRY